MAINTSKLGEDFWRCEDCNSAYFKKIKYSTFEKDNIQVAFEETGPREINTIIVLKCKECGREYDREELQNLEEE